MRKILLSVFGLVLASASIGQVINTYPYVQNFEGEGASTSCSGYVMVAAGWMNDLTDGGNDWAADINGTGSTNTGPTANGGADFNPGVAGGKYMYMETSGCNNDTRNLMSTWFDFTATPAIAMNFAYHMYGADMGTMAVDYREGLGMPWTNLVAPMTDNQDIWQTLESDITFLAGNDSVQFRWVGIAGPSFGSDMAIDDVSVYETSFDGAITGVVDNACFGDQIGEMTATPIYGVPPFTYSWDNGETTATISNLTAGTYCVTITDSNLDQVVVCDSVQDLASAPLQAFAHAVNQWICADSNGVLVIDSITGGATTAVACGISPLGCTGLVDSVLVDTTSLSYFTVGGTGYPSPLGNWYWGARHQMVYTANELSAMGVQPGNISGLAFFIDNLGTATTGLTGWNIKMGCTPDSVATAFNDTATVEVYGATNVVITTGWNWYSFDSPYYWNGSDNLIVETCFNNSSFTNNPNMTCVTTPNTSVVYYRADNSTVCGSSFTTGTSTSRPIVMFENCSAVPTYNYIYSWNNGSSADTTYAPAGTYTLSVSDDNGCTDEVIVKLDPSQPVNVDDVTICETNPFVFSATPGFDTYVWNTAETTADITIVTGGTYYVDAVDSLGCPSSDTALVFALPAPVLAASAADELNGSDGSIALSIYGNAFPFMVDWDNDGTGDNDDSESIFNLTGGDYTVIVTDTNGCYTTLTVTVNSQLGLNEGNSEFKIFPNPTNGVFYIQPISVVGEKVSASVVDAAGRTISTVDFVGTDIVTVDLSAFESGVYFININVDGNNTITKIIKD